MKPVLALCVLTACGGAQQSTAGPHPPGVPDKALAPRDQVAAFLQRQYDLIGAMDIHGWAQLHGPDALFLGSDADEAYVGPQQIDDTLGKEFTDAKAAGGTGAMKSKGLMKIGVTPDGKAAWVADELDFTLTVGGQPQTTQFRVTEVLALDGDRWVILASCWSIGVPNDQAWKDAAAGKWEPLADVGDKVGPGAEPVVALFQKVIADPGSIVDQVRDDFWLFGSDPTEEIDGGAKMKAQFGASMPPGMAIERHGGLRAGLAPNGQLGWVAANIDFTMNAKDKRQLTQPYRWLAVYARDADGWKMVQSHVSNGLVQR